jgi:glycosyltransferase involved in cell wall biosynthesis
MRISIALATYNGERFLGEQLASLARQTLPPHELVVCDDGSTDRTVEVVEDFARAAPFPVVIQRNEANLGFTLNFLQAAARSTGDVVAFCDQDDIWLPHKLQRCAAILRDPEVLLVVHSGEVIDEAGKRLGRRLPAIQQCGKRSGREAPPFVAGREPASPPGFAMVLRKSVFDELQTAWPEELYQLLREQHANVSAHDTLLFFVAKDRGHIYYDDCALVQFRAHRSNTTVPRRAFNAAPTRVRHGLAQALRANARDYARIAERDRAEAMLLAAVYERGGFPSLGRLASTLFARARAFGLRAALYGKRGLQYWKLYIWMLRHGSYGPRGGGGLGLKSAVKELALGWLISLLRRTRRLHAVPRDACSRGMTALTRTTDRGASPSEPGGQE